MSNDPWMINASAGAPAYAAAEVRQAFALGLMYGGRAMGARAGVRPGGTQMQVTLVGSTITVATGVACVDPGLTTPQGPYWVPLSPAETHTLTAAHATLARKDIVVLRVYDDDEDSSGNRFSRSEYIAGVAGSGSEPAVPAGSFRLATIDVPASPGAPVVTNNAPFTTAPGGVVPIRNFSERVGHHYDGQLMWRQDRVNWIEYSDGASYHLLSVPIAVDVADFAQVVNPYSGQLVSNSGDGGVYRYNGTAFRPLPGLIEERILSGTSASETFSSIPQTYRSLRLEIVCRSNVAALATNLKVQFNGDTGATQYDAQSVYGQTATPGAAELLGQNAINLPEMTGASVAADHPGIFTIDIPWYAGTTFMKLVNAQSTWSNGTASGSLVTRNMSGRWRSKVAITSITVLPASGSFIAGSSFSLIGVP